MKKEEMWKQYAWAIRGRQRREVLKNLSERPITAEEFRKEVNAKTSLKLSLREMSRHLTSFMKKGLVTCLSPEAPYGRPYVITSKGKKLLETIKKQNY